MTDTNQAGSPFTKIALEMGPLILFFVANAYGDRLFGIAPGQRIFLATGLFMAAAAMALLLARRLSGEWPKMLLVSTAIVMVFGALTLYLQDETFIKLKPTIANSLFALILAGGLYVRRNLLEMVMGSVFSLDDEGWRILTLRWIGFFILLALLNEVVWRTQTTDTWVNFKVWGIMPLTFLFGLAQVPLIARHEKSRAP